MNDLQAHGSVFFDESQVFNVNFNCTLQKVGSFIRVTFEVEARHFRSLEMALAGWLGKFFSTNMHNTNGMTMFFSITFSLKPVESGSRAQPASATLPEQNPFSDCIP